MVHCEKQPLLGQIGKKAYQIVATAANLGMLPFIQVVDAHMDLGPAGHPASYLFADKEVRMPPKFLGAADGVMVGQSDQVHSTLPQRGVDLSRSAVAFQEKMAQDSHRYSSRMSGVNV